jgi:transposase
LESHSPLYIFNKWARDHEHPYDSLMASQGISELIIDNITERQKKKFYKLQITRRKKDEYLAYDTTSISSTSKLIKYDKYGRNKDKEKLLQINLAMLTGQQSRLPVYYRVLPGNISDVSTVKKLLKYLNMKGIEKVKLMLDRGFYSADNINLMCRDGHKFILSARRNIALLRIALLRIY